MAGISKKHAMFVAEYLACLDSTKAAIKAGYSKKSAQAQGCQLLKHPKVAAEIAKKTKPRLEKLEITAERVLNEIARLAFLDPRKFYDENGNLKPITELDDDTAACLAGLEVDELFEGRGEDREQVGVTKKIKFADKGINLERLGKYLKLFTDKIEATGKDGGPILFKIEKIGAKE